MARKLVVEIVGDSASLERSFARSTKSAQRFDKEIGKIGRGAVGGSGIFQGLGRSIAFASASFLGGFGLVAALRASFDEMSKTQKVAAQTDAAIKSTGAVAGVTADHIDKLAASLLNLSGVDDETIKSSENLLLTFTNVRNVAGKNNDIFDQATKTILDMSVALNEDLRTATIQVGKALQDPVRGVTTLRRVGVQLSDSQQKLVDRLVKSGRVMEAQKIILAELRREFGGSAKAAGDTLGGKLNKLKETLLNVGGAIALQLLPAITKAVDRMLTWIQNTQNQKRVLEDSKQVIGAVSDVLKTLKGALDQLNRITGSAKNSIKLLIGAFIALKAVRLAGGLAAIASDIGLIGANARTSTGEVAGLRASLGKLAGIGTVSVAVAVALTILQTPQYKKAKKDLSDFFGLGGQFNPLNSLPDQFRSFEKQTDKLLRQLGLVKKKANEVLAPPGVLGPAVPDVRPPAGALGPARSRGATPPGEAVSEVDNDLAKRLKAAREAARQAAVDAAGLAVDRAGLTKSLGDDLVALNKLNALLKRRIAGGHGTLELMQQQISVEKQIADLLEQQAEARKAARDRAQFKLLGFGPNGEDLIPGVKSLRKQLGNVADAIAGSFLDTRKTRGLLGHIRQVLAGGLGSVSSDVRSKIQQILADLKSQLKQSSVDVTKFQETARGQFTLAGAHPGGNLTVNGGIHLHGVQDVKALENALAKRRKQRAHARRSTR